MFCSIASWRLWHLNDTQKCLHYVKLCIVLNEWIKKCLLKHFKPISGMKWKYIAVKIITKITVLIEMTCSLFVNWIKHEQLSSLCSFFLKCLNTFLCVNQYLDKVSRVLVIALIPLEQNLANFLWCCVVLLLPCQMFVFICLISIGLLTNTI